MQARHIQPSLATTPRAPPLGRRYGIYGIARLYRPPIPPLHSDDVTASLVGPLATIPRSFFPAAS